MSLSNWKKWCLGLACIVMTGIPLSVEAGLISEKLEKQLGADVAKQFEAQYFLSRDEALNAEVQRIGAILLPYSRRSHLPFSFKVLDHSMVNAAAVPGGHIYVFRGLLEYMPEEHLRAAVIGHEIGHVAKKHSVSAVEKELALQLLLAVAVGDKYVDLQNLFMKTTFSSASRGDERDADYEGFKYTNAVGYNPYSMAMALNRLGAIPNQPKAGIFSDHPNAEARVDRLKKKMSEDGISPMVQGEKKGKPYLVDKKITWPVMAATNSDGYNAIYRAYDFAGRLVLLERAGKFDSRQVFIINGYLFHGTSYLMSFMPGDAKAAGLTYEDYQAQMLKVTKEWLDSKKK